MLGKACTVALGSSTSSHLNGALGDDISAVDAVVVVV
jgi:hypothetical protein